MQLISIEEKERGLDLSIEKNSKCYDIEDS
jgi:hypothetical protein